MARHLLFIAVLLTVSGCGYHLRGSTGGTWNLGALHIQNATLVGAEVQRLLTLNGVKLTGKAADADAILAFTGERQERQVLSVDPETGKVREYELIVDAGIRVAHSDGTVLLEDDSISLQRDYTFDETAALGKYEEEGALYTEIRKDLAAAIVRRLQALHNSPAAASASTP